MRSVFDYLKLYGSQLQPVLAPGEMPLSVLTMQYFPGEEHLGQPVEQGWGIDFDPVLGLHHHAFDHLPDRLLSGVTLIAPTGGRAMQLARMISPTPFVVLTTQRFLLVEGLGHDTSAIITWQCRIDEIAFIRHHPRGPLARGRVALGFRDGSVVWLIAGTITSRRAKQLANAFAMLRGY